MKRDTTFLFTAIHLRIRVPVSDWMHLREPSNEYATPAMQEPADIARGHHRCAMADATAAAELEQIMDMHLHRTPDAGIRANPAAPLVIKLDGRLMCRPAGAAAMVRVNQLFLDGYILDKDSSTGFHARAGDAACAMFSALDDFPVHFVACSPKAGAREKCMAAYREVREQCMAAHLACSGSTSSSLPSAQHHSDAATGSVRSADNDEPPASRGGSSASSGGSYPSPPPLEVTEPQQPAAATTLMRWPAPSNKKVLKGGLLQCNSSKGLGPAIHDGAAWFMCFACTSFKNGCPGECLLMQPRSCPGELHVLFKCDCVHPSGGASVGELAGHRRVAAVDAAAGRFPTHAFSLAVGKLPSAIVKDHNVSLTGKNPQVLRQAISDRRQELYRRDPDPVLSAQKLAKERYEKDQQATPPADQANRLLYGDTPLVMTMADGEFCIVRTTEGQIRRWKYDRCRGVGAGVWADTVGGMVSLCVLRGIQGGGCDVLARCPLTHISPANRVSHQSNDRPINPFATCVAGEGYLWEEGAAHLVLAPQCRRWHQRACRDHNHLPRLLRVPEWPSVPHPPHLQACQGRPQRPSLLPRLPEGAPQLYHVRPRLGAAERMLARDERCQVRAWGDGVLGWRMLERRELEKADLEGFGGRSSNLDRRLVLPGPPSLAVCTG